MAVIWIEIPEESGNAVHTRTSHIPVERLLEVTNQYDAFLNDVETQHIFHCRECLNLFGDLVLLAESGDWVPLLVAPSPSNA